MELIIFFLKTWSIIWTIITVSMVILFIVKKPKDANFLLNIKTCFKWCLYITSIYVWFI